MVVEGLDDKLNVKSLLEGRALAHGIEIQTIDWAYWKFNQSPFGRSIIALAFTLEGEIVGCNAYGILKYHNLDSVVEIATPYETYVHPNFQGMGIFSKLLTMAQSYARDRELGALFFFPNSNSLPGLKRSEFVFINKPVDYYIRPILSSRWFLNPLDIKKPFVAEKSQNTFSKFNFSKNYNVEHTKHFQLCVTSDYLDWRFNYFRENNYFFIKEQSAEFIIRTGHRGALREAQIVYLYFQNSEEIEQNVRAWRKMLRKLNGQFDLIGMPLSKINPAAILCRSHLFLKVGSQTNFCYRAFSDNFKITSEIIDLSGIDFHTY